MKTSPKTSMISNQASMGHERTHGSFRSTRRAWLAANANFASRGVLLSVLAPGTRSTFCSVRRVAEGQPVPPAAAAQVANQSAAFDPASLITLAQHAVEAAQHAGASYADARLTRVVQHRYKMGGKGTFEWDEELVGLGVRALVQGAWGFAASPLWDAEEAVRLARDAVTQGKANAADQNTPVDLAPIPAVTGSWSTPIQIDPFTIPIEEKFDYITYWKARAEAAGISFDSDGRFSGFELVRQEQVLVTSDGTRVVQTRYETGGAMKMKGGVFVKHLEPAGAGWEYLLKVPDQFPALAEELRALGSTYEFTRPLQVGRYTLLCDGTVMANMLDKTLGLATQLDRAMGYEANAGGTSYLNDPLGMIGHFQAASPLVTVTANRSAPTQLATVKWDDEGAEPVDTMLVHNGVLTDFQTTREQATWLAPYYHTANHPVRSNGCAASEDALAVTMQHMPNLAVTPNASDVTLEALAASIPIGILVEGVSLGVHCDFQGRNGVIFPGRMREINKGRIGRYIVGGGISFNSLDFWKNVTALGGASTQGMYYISQNGNSVDDLKGEPAQRTSHTVVAPAAIITKQIVVNPSRKA